MAFSRFSPDGEPALLQLSASGEGTHYEVAVGGELDVASVPKLRACLLDLLAEGCTDLVITLDAVEFCDSSALGVLVGCHRRLKASGGRLELRHPPKAIRHLFSVSGLDQILNVTD